MINPDLHLHTYYSDGKESPAVVVARAKAMGIDVICHRHRRVDGPL